MNVIIHVFLYSLVDNEIVRTTVDAMTQGDLSNLDMKVCLVTWRHFILINLLTANLSDTANCSRC